jgi:hypothetical protein
MNLKKLLPAFVILVALIAKIRDEYRWVKDLPSFRTRTARRYY